MREMVLNHASLASPDLFSARKWLNDTVIGMIKLTSNRVVNSTLRMSNPHYDILCFADHSLHDVLIELQRSGQKEEARFFSRLTTKSPLLSDVVPSIKDRFLACQGKNLPDNEGKPLLFCAIADGIAVGFPTDLIWDTDRITVSFEELTSDGDLTEASEIIDNLTRSIHADAILERSRQDLLNLTSLRELWHARDTLFPNLVFGPDVENHLTELDSSVLGVILKRLDSLNESAREWLERGGAMPEWRCNVTPESATVNSNPELRGSRLFKSHRGTVEIFEWHTRFGNDGRIHLRFDPSLQEIEIGYIGWHLPLAI